MTDGETKGTVSMYGECIWLADNPSEQRVNEAVKYMENRALQFLQDTKALQITVKRNTDPDMWPTDAPCVTVSWKLDPCQLQKK